MGLVKYSIIFWKYLIFIWIGEFYRSNGHFTADYSDYLIVISSVWSEDVTNPKKTFHVPLVVEAIPPSACILTCWYVGSITPRGFVLHLNLTILHVATRNMTYQVTLPFSSQLGLMHAIASPGALIPSSKGTEIDLLSYLILKSTKLFIKCMPPVPPYWIRKPICEVLFVSSHGYICSVIAGLSHSVDVDGHCIILWKR